MWTLVSIYAMIIVLLHIPAIQEVIGRKVASALGEKLGTEVRIGRIDLGFLNRLVIDDVTMLDQKGKPMLHAARLSVSAEPTPLLAGRISISSAQLFGVKAMLYKERAEAKPNFQFVLDSLASKDTTSQKTPLDLHIHSLIIRNSTVSYDQYDVAPTRGKFNPAHISASGISAHIILNRLTNDSLSLNCKRLSLKEAAGLDLRELSFRLTGGTRHAQLTDFNLRLPHTHLYIPQLTASYKFRNNSIALPTLQYQGEIARSQLTLSDASPFLPLFRNFNNTLFLSSAFSGTSTSLRVATFSLTSADHSINLDMNGSVTKLASGIRWATRVGKLSLSARTIEFISRNLKGQKINVPEAANRLGDVTFKGDVGGLGKNIALKGTLETDAGAARLGIGLHDKRFSAHIETAGIQLGKILADPHFGIVATHINVDGMLRNGTLPDLSAKGQVSRFDWNGYNYHDISLDGKYASGTFTGKINMDDPNGKIAIDGLFAHGTGKPKMNLTATIDHLNPAALQLTDKWKGTQFSGILHADISGNKLADANGSVTLSQFNMKNATTDYTLDQLTLHAGYNGHEHFIKLDSDFAHMELNGQYDYNTIVRSITNLVASKLPTLPGLPKATRTPGNTFDLDLTVTRTDWLQALLGIDVQIDDPVELRAAMNDQQHQLALHVVAPRLYLNGTRYEDATILVTTPNDTLCANTSFTKVGNKGGKTMVDISAQAADNHLTSGILFKENKPHGMKGNMNVDARFYKNTDGQSTADLHVLPSEIIVGDTVWQVHPSSISYHAGALHVEDFAIEHNQQYLRIGGNATRSAEDSLTVDLKGINVEYILNLINFHSVDFSGFASGQASIKRVMNKPSAWAKLDVADFHFEDGNMGTLHALVDWTQEENQINIHAIADDGPKHQTHINGYVSPGRSDIELNIDAYGTRLEFMENLCSSFLSDVNANAIGHIRIFGPLKAINMEGKVVAQGTMGVSSLGTTYTLNGDTVTFEPDNIIFHNDVICDKDGHTGVVNGRVTHKNLSNFGYDLNIAANNMLAYDFKTYGDQTFFGTVWATGTCDIKGKSGEVNIDVDVTPERGSFLEYNAVSPDAVNNGQFISWNDRTPQNVASDSLALQVQTSTKEDPDMASDMHINFLINTTPDVTLRVLMDQQSGDMITLNGQGVIRATYYNKGAFLMFGNYLVDHGTYRLTIQNVIRKDFQFLPGSTITFGGNPFDAALGLKAQYAVQGVSLSDIGVGRSFTSTGIRVNCLMNIGGTAGQPRVDFGMELPTLSADAEQMVRSLINTEEEMNQQVLYLLAVGRFYNSGVNTQEGAEQRSQTTLAMQSLLSGTISQQINNVIGTFMGKSNWNFGANISTGDEGWNNAEYEGLLSGRMLGNRLLFNGQFGYRDNANATTSFIGDFDLKYLLTPNGGISFDIYNQTNDRYFTRNSLNTQGIGLELKKDFTSLRDLFGIGRKKSNKNNKQKSSK